jgi:hypothetical protein
MNYLVLVLRLIHILAGAFWVGGSLITTFFITPAVAATGISGWKFLAHLVRNAQLSQRFAGAAGLTVLAGAWLFWIDSAGLTSSWLRSGPGWGFAVGAVFALVGFAFGIRVGVITRKIGGIAAGIQGQPTQDQVLELETVQRQMQRLRLISDAALLIALACMATARYWIF